MRTHPLRALLVCLALAGCTSNKEKLKEDPPGLDPVAAVQAIDRYTGSRMTWYDDGKPRSSGYVLQGREHGTWTYWGPEGQRSAEGSYYHGIREGKWTEWTGAPNILTTYAEYRRGVLAGRWWIETQAGVVMEDGWYEQGKQAGRWIERWPNGQKKAEGDYARGEKVGDWFAWNADGTLKIE
jgi:antitoxin component YwqK of YwqJK toxin-antitoxin module